MTGLEWAPEACTLPTAEQPLRVAEFNALFADALDSSERVGRQHLRLTLSGPAALLSTVEDLAARESRCCSFFDFDITSTAAGRVVLDIRVPPAYVEVLDALAEQASHA